MTNSLPLLFSQPAGQAALSAGLSQAGSWRTPQP